MSINRLYNLWVENALEDKDLISELIYINENENEIYERFYKELDFGTAGLRGIIGAGTNRVNIYTIRKVTQGLANYLKKKYKIASVAIAFDSRKKSDIFSKESASVLAANGIKVYITQELQPTPVLSFAVREYKCQAGIMITASHNPAKYNGYKCYGSDGSQMTDFLADEVYNEIQKLDIFNDIKTINFNEGIKTGIIKLIQKDFYDKYLKNVKSQSINENVYKNTNLKVVYTPLNGAGNKLVRKILNIQGVKNISVVKEQENPDESFKTCPYPNPEIKEALELAIDLAKKEKSDLILATDPDSDRVGIAVKDKDNDYLLMTGNQVGILLLNNTLLENLLVLRTIVSSSMIDVIAKAYNCKVEKVLTGFKYIGEQILKLEMKDEIHRFIFGFEESYGYLVGTYVRDKDAVVASMLICEMAAYYQKKNKTLIDVLNDLYIRYGFNKEKTISFSFEGSKGMEKMRDILKDLRQNVPKSIGGFKVLKVSDYIKSETINLETMSVKNINLPKSNVLSFELDEKNLVIVRPSGTEPKIKVYLTATGKNLKETTDRIKILEDSITKIIKI